MIVATGKKRRIALTIGCALPSFLCGRFYFRMSYFGSWLRYSKCYRVVSAVWTTGRFGTLRCRENAAYFDRAGYVVSTGAPYGTHLRGTRRFAGNGISVTCDLWTRGPEHLCTQPTFWSTVRNTDVIPIFDSIASSTSTST